ncbi:YdhR family protein [Paludibaculum fermentans]|uniref:YdhR family protein n=1 Tax=Paludibaculum fermentans TaxID=1473598 RepID=A0A7S7NNC5_PALFE|nr:YdhR family protein [Paludibaculum fermentans]QOY86719.1 YdhR family protein [Paludibaculum fermentans]
MILQINFTLDAPVAKYRNLVDSGAQAFLDVPGLRWKIWLLNPAAREAGGIYLFDSQASLDAYLDGPLVAQLKALTGIRNLSMKRFEVMPEPTALTRGPFDAERASGTSGLPGGRG